MAQYTTIVAKTVADTPYSITTADEVVLVDSSGGAVTVNLPTAASIASKVIIIKDNGGAAFTNNITIGRTGGENIDNVAADWILNANDAAIEILSFGGNFLILSSL